MQKSKEVTGGDVACSSGHAVFEKVIESLQSRYGTVAGTELMGTGFGRWHACAVAEVVAENACTCAACGQAVV